MSVTDHTEIIFAMIFPKTIGGKTKTGDYLPNLFAHRHSNSTHSAPSQRKRRKNVFHQSLKFHSNQLSLTICV